MTALTTEKFNGVALFGTNSLPVPVTESGASTVIMAARDLANTGTGVGALTAAGITTLGNTGLVLSTITNAVQNVATMRSSNGAEQSRLGFASQLLAVNKANLEVANSRITDVDVASESTQLARWNTLVQAGASMLAQANSSAQTALKLLQ